MGLFQCYWWSEAKRKNCESQLISHNKWEVTFWNVCWPLLASCNLWASVMNVFPQGSPSRCILEAAHEMKRKHVVQIQRLEYQKKISKDIRDGNGNTMSLVVTRACSQEFPGSRFPGNSWILAIFPVFPGKSGRESREFPGNWSILSSRFPGNEKVRENASSSRIYLHLISGWSWVTVTIT